MDVNLLRLGPIGVGVALLVVLLRDEHRPTWVPVVIAMIAAACILPGLFPFWNKRQK
jgi:hypothetical protein